MRQLSSTLFGRALFARLGARKTRRRPAPWRALAVLPVLMAAASAQSDARSVRVAVVDANGRPAGVLRVILAPDHPRAPRGVRPQSRLTDTSGTVTFDLEALDPDRTVRTWRVQPAMPGDVNFVSVDCTAGPVDTTLRLPPAGSVRYVFYDRTGTPADGFAEARLWAQGSVEPIAVDGESVTFYPVPLRIGAQLTVEVDGIHGPLVTRALGPEVIGGMRVVVGGYANCNPILELRVRDQAGAIANAEVGVIYAAADRVCTTTVDTTAEGTIRWAVPCHFSNAEHRAWLDLEELQVICVPKTGRQMAGSVTFDPIADRPEQPDVDVGKIKLEPCVSIGVSHVVDADGNGVAGILVRSSWTGVDNAQFPNVSPMLADWAWLEHRATTDDEGRYEFFGLGPPRRDADLYIHAPEEWRERRRRSVRVGRGLPTIILDRAFALEGSLVPAPPKGVRIIARARGVEDRQARPIVVGADGRFSLSGLPPQKYDIRILGHQIRGVVVGPDAEPDGRLTGIDWSEHYRLLQVRVVGPDQRAVRTQVAGRTESPRKSVNFGRTDARGMAAQLVPKGQVEIEVRGNRRFFRRVASTSGSELTVEVQPCPEVQVRLAGAAAPAGVELVAALVDEDASVRLEHHGWVTDSGPGVQTIRLTPFASLKAFDAGRYKVILLPGPTGQAAVLPAELQVPLAESHIVVSDEGEAPETVTLKLKDPSVLARIRDALRRGR